MKPYRRPPVERNRLPKAVLIMLSGGAVSPDELRDAAAAIAGNRHAANVAIGRLEEKGLLTREVKLTAKGRMVLEGLR